MSNPILSIEVPSKSQEDILAVLDKAKSAEARRGLSAALGKRGEIELRKHFASRPSNKQGWKSSGFWRRRIRQATSLTSYDESGATVTIADPAMNQKIYGGTLRPVEKKFLTIPARREAAGVSPRTFGNQLMFIPLNGKGGGKLVGMLVKRPAASNAGATKRKRGKATKPKLEVYYWCVSSVWQAPDKNALPSDAQFMAALLEEQTRYEARRLGRSRSGAVGLAAVNNSLK